MSEKKKQEIVVEYIFGPEYREIYVNGARGGVQNGYHLKIDFYVERTSMPFTKERLEMGEDGKTERIPLDAKDTLVVEREFKVGLILSFHAARELFLWLSQRVKEIEQVERHIREGPSATVTIEESKKEEE